MIRLWAVVILVLSGVPFTNTLYAQETTEIPIVFSQEFLLVSTASGIQFTKEPYTTVNQLHVVPPQYKAPKVLTLSIVTGMACITFRW